MTKKNYLKKIIIITSCTISLCAVYLLGHLGYNYFSGNVHTVIPGEIYRTAQLDDKQLKHYTQKFHLKSIINLRGVWENDHWYIVESRFVKTHQLHYYPIRLSAYNLPTKAQLRELVHLLQTAPRPLAFHCEGGADRTGMAAAISVILFRPHPTITEIKEQASWRYNAISRETVGYQLLKNYFAWLKKHHYQQSKDRFLQWVASPAKMKPYTGRFWIF